MGELGIREVFGLDPLPLRLREAWMALRGDASVPKTRFDTTSLKILRPELSLRTWLGQRREDRLIPLYNLVNHTPTPVEEGWSVRKTQVQDFRGKSLTYDSHNGTDFAIPVGTLVVAPAAGRVLRISSEFHRGGLKIFIDHGRGLFTTSNHLGRALVSVGERVRRGQPIALSGYSGLDGFAAFPWSVPHVHFNVWLGGRTADPFALTGEEALWLEGNEPRPPSREDDDYQPTRFDRAAILRAIDACKDPAARDRLRAGVTDDDALSGMSVLVEQNYFPTRFEERVALFEEDRTRSPRLSVPFSRDDFKGIHFPD